MGCRVNDPRFLFPAVPTLYDPSHHVQVEPVNMTGCHSHDYIRHYVRHSPSRLERDSPSFEGMSCHLGPLTRTWGANPEVLTAAKSNGNFSPTPIRNQILPTCMGLNESPEPQVRDPSLGWQPDCDPEQRTLNLCWLLACGDWKEICLYYFKLNLW